MEHFKLLRGYQEKRIFNIDLGPINETDIQYLIERLRVSMMVPARYLSRHEEVQLIENENTNIHR